MSERGTRASLGVALGLLALLLAGCRSTAACKPGTILLHIDLGNAAEQTMVVSVRVTGSGNQLLSSGELPRPAGQRQGSVEVGFTGGYPANQMVTIQVEAQRSGRSVIVSRSLAVQLEAGCSALSIELEPDDAGVDASDAASTDLALPDRPDSATDANDAADAPGDVSTEVLPDAGPDPDADPDAAANDASADGADAEPADLSSPPDAAPDTEPDMPPDTGPPAARRRVFVTSTRHTGNLGGLAGANGICQTRAGEAGLTGVYKAWLSTGGLAPSGPSANLIHSSVPYELVGGERVADSWNDLVDGSLDHAIDQDERGRRAAEPNVCDGGVWTNTTAAGGPKGGLLPPDCGGWTNNTATSSTGSLKRNDGRWTDSCSGISCATDLPLYCFEQ